MSSDFIRYLKIDLGTQPWSVISLFQGSDERWPAYAGGDHGGSILDFERAASRTSPHQADDLAVGSGEGLQLPGEPLKHACLTKAKDENTWGLSV